MIESAIRNLRATRIPNELLELARKGSFEEPSGVIIHAALNLYFNGASYEEMLEKLVVAMANQLDKTSSLLHEKSLREISPTVFLNDLNDKARREHVKAMWW